MTQKQPFDSNQNESIESKRSYANKPTTGERGTKFEQEKGKNKNEIAQHCNQIKPRILTITTEIQNPKLENWEMKLRIETLIWKNRKWKRQFEYENEKESEFKPNLNKIKPNLLLILPKIT